MTISVLIVEDELITRMALAMTLRGDGFAVSEAVNADEAWRRLSDRPVDVVFSDVQMKGSMNGIQLAQKVREHFPATKIILTSGHYSPNGLEDYFTFLPKPYSLSDMKALMNNAGSPEVEA